MISIIYNYVKKVSSVKVKISLVFHNEISQICLTFFENFRIKCYGKNFKFLHLKHIFNSALILMISIFLELRNFGNIDRKLKR